MIRNNIVSVSGGKDSTALLLLAIERQTENLQAVFADTGHEHQQTYEYVQYLSEKVFPNQDDQS
jgi:3'-phosphoadenosine 5'-phosphosulfate sulfotransferase (PAPS reductase)/FAD synthetase